MTYDMKIMTLLAILMLIPFMTTAMAQETPREDKLVDMVEPVGITDKMQEAHNILSDIMSGLDVANPVGDVITDEDINTLGFMVIDGKNNILLGIDEDIYEDRASIIKEELYERFPGIEFHIVSAGKLILDSVKPDTVPVTIAEHRVADTPIPKNTFTQNTTLKQKNDYTHMGQDRQETIQSPHEFITAQSAYDLDRNKLLIKGTMLALQVQFTDDEQRLEELKSQHDALFVELDEFGVGPSDKTFENPDYYFDKYDQKLEEYAKQGYAVTDMQTDDASLNAKVAILFFSIHQTSVWVSYVTLSLLFVVLEPIT